MDEGDQLLAAVLAHPEQDAPRAMYADWLIERGEPRGHERGEFIRHSLNYAEQAEVWDAPTGYVFDQEYPVGAGVWPYEEWPDSLFAALDAGTNDRWKLMYARPHWNRGFIDRAEVEAHEFVRPGFCENLFRRHPVRGIGFIDREPQDHQSVAESVGFGWSVGVCYHQSPLKHVVPPELVTLMRRSLRLLNKTTWLGWADFATREIALAELESAAMQFGRERARAANEKKPKPRKPRRAK